MLRALWIAGFSIQVLVGVALVARWAVSGHVKPPELSLPLVLGCVGVLAGLRLRGLARLALWIPSWCALGYVVKEMVELQARLTRGLPGMYLLVFVGVGLLALASLGQLSADRQP